MPTLFPARNLLPLSGTALIAVASATCCVAQTPAKTLERAAHCSVTAWLIPDGIKTSNVAFGYAKAAAGTNDFGHPIYVVMYLSADRKQGYIFDIGYTENHGQWVLKLQNNAKFVLMGKDVNFIEPPLGGTWTQQHLIEGVHQIGTQTPSSFRLSALRQSDSSVACKSYANPDLQAGH